MPRDYEIKHAFMNAMRREPGLGVIVTTQEFVRQLELLNWHFSLREANQWIRANTVTFRDASTQRVKSPVRGLSFLTMFTLAYRLVVEVQGSFPLHQIRFRIIAILMNGDRAWS